jgi:hypothetical protein
MSQLLVANSGGVSGAGRGRGGGQKLLPDGLWDAINAGSAGADEIRLKDPGIVPASDRFEDVNDKEIEEQRSRANKGSSRLGTGRQHQDNDKGVQGPDWSCGACGNVNWARRAICNICNAPKPKASLTEDEIRTGAGGGFNERQERAAVTVYITCNNLLTRADGDVLICRLSRWQMTASTISVDAPRRSWQIRRPRSLLRWPDFTVPLA